MADPALLPSPNQHTLTTLVTTCERWATTKADELARRRADLARLAEQVQDLEADVHQAHILLAYLRSKAAAA